MSELNSAVNNTVNDIENNTINNTDKNIDSFIEGKPYWFIVNDWAYNGVYIKKDRFLANNIMLVTIDSVTWSADIHQVFETKEECNEYAKKYYGEDYKTGALELKFGSEYVIEE